MMKYFCGPLLLIALLTASARTGEPTPVAGMDEKAGILVMAHGGDEHWNRLVEEAVAPLRQKYVVEIAFGMAQRSTLKKAVEQLEAQGVRQVAVVRLFLSGDSFVDRTRYILGLKDPPAGLVHDHLSHAGHHDHDTAGAKHGDGHAMDPPLSIHTRCRFVVSSEGLAASPLVDEILIERVRELSTDPSQESVLLLAHGPGDEAENERWLAQMRLRAAAIHRLGPFRHVQCETLREDWPDRRVWAEKRIRRYIEDAVADGGRVIVVPFRVAGFGPYQKVLEGLQYIADGQGLLPHPNITRWIEETAQHTLATAAGSDPGVATPSQTSTGWNREEGGGS